MKNFFPALLTILVLSIPCGAQAQSKTYVGVKGGYNLSTTYFFHSFNGSGIRTGFEGGGQAGLIVMHFLENHVGLQAELLYTQKGWSQQFSNGQPDFITELDYLELPLLVNLYTGKKKNHFFANLGCFGNYLLAVRQSTPPSDTTGESFYPFDEERDPKFGYGFRGGLGIFHDFTFGTLMLESSYSFMLSDLLDPGSLDTGIPNISQNSTVSFTLAYLFSFGEL